MSGLALFISVFLACAVEAVEATTIVLAAGTARDWRSAISGTVSALGVLGIVVWSAGPRISQLPIEHLRLFVGGLLLVFGLQWVRKAILRSSGFKALHDEDAIFQEEVISAKKAKSSSRLGIHDWYAFTLSFKGVLLEGLEVAFIVLTFGTIQNQVGMASLAAIAAVVVVASAGFALRKPLARVPENTMKFCVGIMLTSFGIFWGAEGSGAIWPGKDLSLIFIIAFMTALSFLLVALLRKRHLAQARISHSHVQSDPLDLIEEDELEILQSSTLSKAIKAFAGFWFDFLIGDDWRGTLGILCAFFLTSWLSNMGTAAWWVLPLTIAALMPFNLMRVTRAT